MKENEFLDGINNIDEDIVERFVSMDNRLRKKASQKRVWIRVGALAACFALIASVVLSVISNVVPTWNTAHYSASDIAKLFPAAKGPTLTNAYTEVYVPNAKYLPIDEMTDKEYLPVYKYGTNTKKLNKTELKRFVSGFLPKLAESLNTSAPKYEIRKFKGLYENSLEANEYMGEYTMLIQQYGYRNWFCFYNHSNYSDRKIVLDGEAIQIDQRLDDKEVLDSIQSIKNKLFEIFSVSFEDTKIIREFDSHSEHGAGYIYIYFYNEDAHPLNKYQDQPVSDYILISFDNFSNYAEDVVSDSILTDASVHYSKNRINASKEYAHIANAKRISLEEAEELLYKGYVFGGHSCPLCMAAQDKISFEGYEFVDIEYIYDMYSDKPTDVIPFYAFYKKTGTSKNGNTVYAKTYVPAIAVYGYEEYFENQAANHR